MLELKIHINYDIEKLDSNNDDSIRIGPKDFSWTFLFVEFIGDPFGIRCVRTNANSTTNETCWSKWST